MADDERTFDPAKVDLVSVTPSGGDHVQPARAYPDTAGLAREIVVHCQSGMPDARSVRVLDQVREGVRRHDGELRVGTGISQEQE